MVITMAKLRMAHASTHGARKQPGPIIVRGLKKLLDVLIYYSTGLKSLLNAYTPCTDQQG